MELVPKTRPGLAPGSQTKAPCSCSSTHLPHLKTLKWDFSKHGRKNIPGPLPPCFRFSLTLSLFSFRLTMTAVICWSMKIRMVTNRAGRMLAGYTHQGFFPNGATNQPRSGRVG